MRSLRHNAFQSLLFDVLLQDGRLQECRKGCTRTRFDKDIFMAEQPSHQIIQRLILNGSNARNKRFDDAADKGRRAAYGQAIGFGTAIDAEIFDGYAVVNGTYTSRR